MDVSKTNKIDYVKHDQIVRASITMPVYNGEKYIREQIDSILDMLGQQDELVISYDISTDATLDIISEYSKWDARIKVVQNTKPRGVWNNSNNAIKHARGKYILFSDQDDVWLDNKVDYMVGIMEETGAAMAMHDGYVCDAELRILPSSMFVRTIACNSGIRNFIKNSYTGCCMIVCTDILRMILKAPYMPDAGDQLVGIACGMFGKVVLVNNCFIKHRLHENNLTPKYKRSLRVKLRARFGLLRNLVALIRYIGDWKRGSKK